MERLIEKGKVGGWRPNSGRKPGFVGYWAGKKRPGVVWEHLKQYHKTGEDNYFHGHKYEGESHGMWKGDEVGYVPLHQWVYRKLGKPTTCEFCGRTGLTGKAIHWANKSKTYMRDTADWLRLCAKCHYHYDH